MSLRISRVTWRLLTYDTVMSVLTCYVIHDHDSAYYIGSNRPVSYGLHSLILHSEKLEARVEIP